MLEPLLIVAAAVVAIITIAHLVSVDARTRRALKRPVTPIARLRPGERARVRGRVVAPAEALRAPLSDRPCVYYVAIVVQESANNNWRELAKEERAVDFELDDGTGRLRVRMARTQALVVRDHRPRSGPGDDPDPAERAFLDRHKLGSTNSRGKPAATRYYEGVLEPDEPITALGIVRREEHDGALVLEAPADGPLYVSDERPAVEAP